jgi:NDP-sugar pyrophosphorylase family protein
VLHSLPESAFARDGQIDPTAELHGRVGVGRGTRIGPGARLEGPTLLGRNVVVEAGARVGPSTAVGDGAVIRGASVERSIVLEGAEIDGPLTLRDSIVGRRVRIRVQGPNPLPMSCILGDATQLTV